MAFPKFDRLRLVVGGILALVLAVLGMGGPTGTAGALKDTINYLLNGSGYTAPEWLATEGLAPIRPLLFAGMFLALIWVFIPTKTDRKKSSPNVPRSIQGSATLLGLEMSIGPLSTLSPENRLNEAYAKFHGLADRADRGDAEAAALAKVAAPWAREAARFYYASSGPYHRIKRNILSRLSRLDDAPALRRHMLPNDPEEIDRGSWELHFNPRSANAIKTITFLPSGQIDQGRNHNEATWTLDHHLLTVRRADGTLQNEFIYVPGSNYFACTNEAGAAGIPNQAIRRK